MPESGPWQSVAQTLEIIGRCAPRLPVVRVSLEDVLGLTLAEAVRTDMDYPPFDRAIMDGFAVRSADCQGNVTELSLIGEIAAGGMPGGAVKPGEAMRINTGAMMPPGADAVAVIEHASISPDGRRMATSDRPQPGDYVARQGSSVRYGQVVLDVGTIVGPAQIAAGAAAGAAALAVYRRPRLAVLATGDELVSVAEQPRPGQIRDANRPALLALARQAGCETLDLGVAGDHRAGLEHKVDQGLAADVLCISGGVSMGQYDLVPEVLEAAGVRFEVRKVAVKPGKPLHMGLGPGQQMVFGLPGNPVSTFVCFHLFVRAALAAMQGRPADHPPAIIAKLEQPLGPVGPRTSYIPAKVTSSPAGLATVRPVPWQGSGDLFGLALANGLIVREHQAAAVPAGSRVPVIRLD